MPKTLNLKLEAKNKTFDLTYKVIVTWFTYKIDLGLIMPSKRCMTGSFKNQLTNSAPETLTDTLLQELSPQATRKVS